LENVCIASIGPETSKSCQNLLGKLDVEAKEYTLDGLTEAIVEWATKHQTL
jgi:uroporphyrinogen III methyltransferase/synthase